MDVHDTYDGSDEEIERQAPATESAPRGARRFSEKYPENKAQVNLPACCSVTDQSRPLQELPAPHGAVPMLEGVPAYCLGCLCVPRHRQRMGATYQEPLSSRRRHGLSSVARVPS